MGSTGENVAPSFVKKPQLRQEDDGNRLIFECKLAGSPKPEVVWFREDVTIVEDNRTRISVNEDGRNQYSVILELNDVVETDAGLYKVKAKTSMERSLPASTSTSAPWMLHPSHRWTAQPPLSQRNRPSDRRMMVTHWFSTAL